MFQQFKNIFPTASLNIRSLTETVGLNDTDWNRGVERLGALRNEFQSLNSIFRQDSNDTLSTNVDTPSSSVTELEATGQLINVLQDKWNDLQETNQANFEKAQRANSKLKQLQEICDSHYKVCESMVNVQQDLEEIHTNLVSIQSSAENLISVLSTLENEIDKVSVDYEKREFEVWKENEEKELMVEIDKKRRLLQERENELRQKYEEHDSMQKKKRLELYEANFNAELEDYRRRRETEVSSLYSHHSTNLDEKTISVSLEKLNLISNKSELDDFLDDDSDSGNVMLQTDIKKKKTIIPSRNLSSSDDDDNDDNGIEILDDEDYA
ncbi:MAG: hypothetical protein EXX96DRAFT_567540 [Benjaminiella poitrasii]|nr:MAG: hypothetical protein EXX96DRAFT_567540 [Benjaminiella poitrasii]